MARKKIIAGNWKMNKTPSEAVALINELKPLVANEEVDVGEEKKNSLKFFSEFLKIYSLQIFTAKNQVF